MKVILLQDVPKTGRKYEVKEIADGYALNFLIPRGLAKLATDKAVKELEDKKIKHDSEEKAKEEAFVSNIKELKDAVIVIKAKINEEGHLFAKIDKEDIVKAIKDQKTLEISDDFIILEKPIKEAGEHEIKVKANEESTTFKLNIISDEE